jgi:hypothetical protein
MRRGQPLAGGVGLHQLRGLQRCRGDHGLPAAAVGRFVASAGLPAAVDGRAEAVCARGGRREIGYTPPGRDRRGMGSSSCAKALERSDLLGTEQWCAVTRARGRKVADYAIPS